MKLIDLMMGKYYIEVNTSECLSLSRSLILKNISFKTTFDENRKNFSIEILGKEEIKNKIRSIILKKESRNETNKN